MIKDKTNQTKKTPTNINKNSNNLCENFLDVEINTNKLYKNILPSLILYNKPSKYKC